MESMASQSVDRTVMSLLLDSIPSCRSTCSSPGLKPYSPCCTTIYWLFDVATAPVHAVEVGCHAATRPQCTTLNSPLIHGWAPRGNSMVEDTFLHSRSLGHGKQQRCLKLGGSATTTHRPPPPRMIRNTETSSAACTDVSRHSYGTNHSAVAPFIMYRA
jgi:hypothetical protein